VTNPHFGSSLEDFLEAEGILEEATEHAMDQTTNYLNEHNKYARLEGEIASLKTELANARVVLAAYDELVDGLRAELAEEKEEVLAALAVSLDP
jgi:hypothetical protein